MVECGFEVVLRPDVRLLCEAPENADESFYEQAQALNECLQSEAFEINYENTRQELLKDINTIIRDVLPTRYGKVIFIESNVGVSVDNGKIYITGVVYFDMPNYVLHRSTKEDVSSKLADKLVEWYTDRSELHDILQEVVDTHQPFDYMVLAGYEILESEAFITASEVASECD